MTSTRLTPTLASPTDLRDRVGDGRHSSTGQPPAQTPRRPILRRLAGDPTDPRWARPSLFALLFATAVAYLYNLSASGMGNSFYAAAVQAGTKSWKAFFFGSFDSSNYITVDKPPASLWVMELSGRIFGFSSWSMLAPQAIEGVVAVALLYGAVKRISGPAAGLAAGAMLALTPAAALMFRFNNPDAFLVLLLVAGGYFIVRALQSGGTKWLVLAGACVGFGFITKMGQALLVVPAFALAYLIAGPPKLGKRIVQLLLSGLAMVAAAGWWIAIVELTPASDRPYIGGSTDNNILNLAFAYNGFGRLFGGNGNGGGGGGGGGNSGFGGSTGLTRLFDSEMGLQISWLLPAALIALVAGLWMTRRAPRTDLARAALMLWGGWLVVTGLVFSYMEGTIHPYYTVALAPAIAGLVATTGTLGWKNRATAIGQVSGVAMLVSTGVWSYHLLDETPNWFPPLRYLSVVLAVLGSAALLANRWHARRMIVAAVAAGAVILSGGGAYALATTSVAHTGSIPTVGSASSSSASGMGGGGFGGGARSGSAPTGNGSGGFSGAKPSGAKPSGTSGEAGGTPPTGSSTSGAAGQTAPTATSTVPSAGGQDSGESTNTALVALLKASTTKWAAAASSSMTAGPLELSSGKAVMSVGGFTGSDNAITLAKFEALVKAGDIHYLIASGNGGGGIGGGGQSTFSDITTWAAAHYKAITVGETTVYDLTTAK